MTLPPAIRRILRPGHALPPVNDATVQSLAARLETAGQARLGRSLALLHVNTGSCNGCELEVRALTRNLREALEQAWDATPEPKWVVAVGDCAVDGGVFKGSYAVLGGVGGSVPVDLTIAGCPPSPARLLAGLRGLLEANAR